MKKINVKRSRKAPDMLLYQFTISDPATYITPWSGEITMRSFAGPVYEYACHEEITGWNSCLQADGESSWGCREQGI
jgi:hypothetical protein